MFEDYPRIIEGKYLHNFSHKEKEQLMRDTMAYNNRMEQKIQKLEQGIASDSPQIDVTFIQNVGNTAEEIKYVLNRIAANDPRDTAFELAAQDEVKNVNHFALDIAKAFHSNTHCKRVVLSHIGLTDNGMLLILRALSRKELDSLDISGNRITDASLQLLDSILANPETKWGQVSLGTVNLTRTRAKSFKKYPNLRYQTKFDEVKRKIGDFCASLG